MSLEMLGMDIIAQVAAVMAGYGRPWFVSGGWAIDLHLQRSTRAHEDLEIGVLRADQEAVREHLAGWQLDKAVQTPEGGAWQQWLSGERMELPLFQVRARRSSGPLREFELFLNEAQGPLWCFRRDTSLTRPLEEVVFRTPDGVPYLAPEVQLLYKAKHHRAKDEQDFSAAVGMISRDRRVWLRDALARFHPVDPWIAHLEREDA